jgi:adenylate cyclase
VEEGFAFCPHCGARIQEECQKCGKAVEKDWKACPHCGAKLG